MSDEPKTAKGISRKLMTGDGRRDSQFVKDLKDSERAIKKAAKKNPLW
jgi:hypothetical protein